MTKPKLLIEPEFAPLYDSWQKQPSPAQTGALLRSLAPVISRGLRAYGGAQSAKSPNPNAKAKQIVLEALPSYRPEQAKLSSFVLTHLQRLQRLAPREGSLIPIPEQIQLDRRHLTETEQQLRDELGRDPSDLELAGKTRLSPARIRKVRGWSSDIPSGAMTSYNEGEEGAETYMPAVQSLGDDDQQSWENFVYHGLSPVDQVVMEHSFGYGGKKVLPGLELAKRLGLSPGAISQRKARIQSQLSERQSLEVF